MSLMMSVAFLGLSGSSSQWSGDAERAIVATTIRDHDSRFRHGIPKSERR